MAEQGGISGRVTDLTGKPVVEAAIFIVGEQARSLDVTVLTDVDGCYCLENLRGGVYTVEVDAQGRKPVVTEVLVNPGHVTDLNFVLPY